VEKDVSPDTDVSPAPVSTKKSKSSEASPDQDVDTPMADAPAPPKKTKKPKTRDAEASEPNKPKSVPSQPQEDFGAIYLRKIAAELADDLDKVREAQDFKANSVPMLIHALKQGESMFSAEERRRVVGAAGQ